MLLCLALLTTAEAAPPEGTHLMLGAQLLTQLADDQVAAPATAANLRIQGERALLDLELGGGLFLQDERSVRYESNEAGERVFGNLESTELDGWTASVGTRAMLRLRGGEDLQVFGGATVAWRTEELSGPWTEEWENDETGEVLEETVGTVQVLDRSGVAGASIVAQHWLTERVALSGMMDLHVIAWRTSSTEDERDDTGLVESERSTSDQALGLFPRAGLAVHLRL